MNRNPELKAFLKLGEVDKYEGIEVEWIRGRKAAMHIYDDGKEAEIVDLFDLITHDEIVKKIEEKGFHLKSSETLMKERVLKNELALVEKFSMNRMNAVLMRICAVTAVVLFIVRLRKRKKRLVNRRQNDLIV